MGQASVDAIILGQRVYLSFAVELPKTTGKNNTVVILVKCRTPLFIFTFFTAQPNGGEQLRPTHDSHSFLRVIKFCEHHGKFGR